MSNTTIAHLTHGWMASASKLLSANPRSHFPNSSFGQTLNFDANKNSLFIDNGFEDTVEIDVPVDHPEPSLDNDSPKESVAEPTLVVEKPKPLKNRLVHTSKIKSTAAPTKHLKLPPLQSSFDKIAYISEENKIIEKFLIEK